MSTAQSTVRKRIAGVALVGAIAGAGVIAASVAASAADATPAPATSTSSNSGATDSDSGRPAQSGTVDESKSVRSDEHLLTGTDATSATAAALAAYPGATIQRVETDSDGVYEAHLVTAAGERLTVQMDATFTVTGTQTGGPGGGKGDGTHGPADGARGTTPTDAPSATTTS